MIPIIDTLKSMGNYPVVNAEDVGFSGNQRIDSVVNNKVDKIEGKGLSTNDYTSAEKNRLSELSSEINEKADTSTVSLLSDRLSDSEEEIAIQSARIDSIATLPSGSTSGDAELIDIRVGTDNITYSSAGVAVRSQISDIKNDISVDDVVTTYQSSTIATSYDVPIYYGQFINGVTGEVNDISEEGYWASGYLPCKYRDIFTIYENIGSLFAVYDENGNFIYGVNNQQNRDKNIEYVISAKNAAYLRFSIYKETVSGRTVKNTSKLHHLDSKLIRSINWDSECVLHGYFVNCNTGALVPNSTLYATDYVNIVGCKFINYAFIQSNSIIAFYDKDKNFISGIEADKGGKQFIRNYTVKNIPNNAVYARFTMDSKSDAGSGVTEGQFSIKLFYKSNINVDSNGNTSFNNDVLAKNGEISLVSLYNRFTSETPVFWVNQNCTATEIDERHYNILSDCVKEACKFKNSTVYVCGGNYELLDEHNADYWYNNRIADRYAGIELKNGIKIIGLGCSVNIKMTYTGSNNTYKENLSPFVVSGSFHLENINIISTECSYCVHDDAEISPNVEYGINGYYINCGMIHNGRTNFVSGGSIDECIGGGASRGGVRVIDGGVYVCKPETCDYVMSYHKNGTMNSDFAVSIKNVYSDTGTLLISSFGNGSNHVIVCNSKFAKNIVLPDDDPNTVVRAFNNVIG